MESNAKPEKELFEFQKSLLSKEIEHIHSQISHFDDLSFQIKGWAITVWSALIAFGAKERLSIVILASLPAILSFWILDTFFKQYQRRYMNRKSMIELFFASEGEFKDRGLSEAFCRVDFGNFPIHDPISSRSRRLSKDFESKYKERTKYWRAFTVPNVLYFYLLLILSTIVVAIVTFLSQE
jgi:hypothetical protein